MWKTVKLGDVCKIVNGSTPSRKESKFWADGDVPWFTIDDMRLQGRDIFSTAQHVTQTAVEEKKVKLIPENSVLLCCTASIGEAAIARQEMATNQQFNALTPLRDELSCEYLYYIATTLKEQLMRVSGSTTISFVSMGKLREIEIPLPPLPEQQRIVTKLDAAFAEIDRAVDATNSNSLQLDALREKIVAKEMLSHANSKDGTTKSLAEVCDLQNGYAFKSKDYIESSNTLNIRMSNIRPNGDFDANHNARYLPDSYAEEYSQFLLNEGDLVIAMTDMAGDPKILGVPTLVTGLQGRNFLLNQRVGRLWKFSPGVYVPFLSRFLTTLKSYYKSKGAGGLQINISKKEILSATIHLPPYDEQVKSVERIDSLLAGCKKIEHTINKKLNSLSQLKSAILAQELQPPQSEAA